MFRARVPSHILIAAGLMTLALLAAVLACRQIRILRPFNNPVAFTFVRDTLMVVEKERNTILQLAYVASDRSLRLTGAYAIEPDDRMFYYMVRKLYPGPQGVVVQSHIFNRKTKQFAGYRFRHYSSFTAPPQDILTVFLKDPTSYPEFRYACDRRGQHYFAHNCIGWRNLLQAPAAGQIVIVGDSRPPAVREFGDLNTAASQWTALQIGADDHIFVSSVAPECIVEYAPDGHRLREIGTVGFQAGDLLAPMELSFVAEMPSEPARLTVASTGNRNWIQYDPQGRVLRTAEPLQFGYPFPDILVGQLFHTSAGLCSFDLANKSLIAIAPEPVFITRYQGVPRWYTCPGWGLALLFFLGAIAVLWWKGGARKLRFPFFVKLLILFIPLLVFSALNAGDWVRDVLWDNLKEESFRRSKNLAQAVLNSLSPADLEAIQRPQDRESPAYERVYATINRIVDTKHVDNTPKWILHKIRDGRFYFGINIWRGPIFEPFIVPNDRPMFFKVLKEKTPQSGEFTDEQGRWFSYLAPILNARGQVIYVLELYRPTEVFDRINRKVTWEVIAIVTVTVLLATVLLLIFSYWFTRPLRRLIQGTEIISSGDFDYTISVRSRDEISDLAGAFNHMTMRLKQYIADLARTTAEKQRIQSELQFAREVQQSMLPKIFPPLPGIPNIEIFARIQPAREVGGDYYDFFLVDADHLGVVIGDVAGKGVSAGLFMMVVRTLLHANAPNTLSAAQVITALNQYLAADNPSAMFVTLFYLIIDLRTGRLTFCSAGHNPPVRIGADTTAFLVTPADAGHGPVIGIEPKAVYTDAELILAPGESLLLYTDGVTEAIDRQEIMYGDERLLNCLRANRRRANREIGNRLVEDVMHYQRGLDQFDDIAVLLLTYRQNPQAAGGAEPATPGV